MKLNVINVINVIKDNNSIPIPAANTFNLTSIITDRTSANFSVFINYYLLKDIIKEVKDVTERIMQIMDMFQPNTRLKTRSGSDISIVEYLASGRQGHIYIVEYGGKKKALKWYKPDAINDPDKFYDNLVNNVNKGSPDPSFLWPQAVTEKTNNSFGFIMDLRPEGYIELSRLMASHRYNFKSFKDAVDSCMKIVSSFRILHNAGMCYQDISCGNFFINPSTGDILICDNDNVSPNLTNTGVLGTPRFMAPEIVTGNGDVMPDIKSDLHSLATVLFMILFNGHPLEGKNWISTVAFPDECAAKIYGIEPLFIFDTVDKSNAPVEKIHGSVIERWNLMPDYVKNMFIRAFGQESLKNPSERPVEHEWLSVLTRFMCDIAQCSCGNEVFIHNASTTLCDRENCRKPVIIEHTIKLPRYTVPALTGSTIYKCQLGACKVDEALAPVLRVVAKADNPDRLGVENMTNLNIVAVTPSGTEKKVKPGESIPLISGITLTVYDKTVVLN